MNLLTDPSADTAPRSELLSHSGRTHKNLMTEGPVVVACRSDIHRVPESLRIAAKHKRDDLEEVKDGKEIDQEVPISARLKSS